MEGWKRWYGWFVAGVFALSLWGAASLTLAQEVYRNTQNEDPALSSLIDFAARSLSERAGFDVDVAGTTTQHCVAGAITFRSYTASQWASQGLPAIKEAVTAPCSGGGSVIVLNKGFALRREIVIHELGHALGIANHAFSLQSIMYSNPGVGYLVTPSDAQTAISNAAWPLYSAPSLCHVELAPDYDLLIPNIAGKQVLLNFTGSGSWSVVYSVPATQSCANNTQHSNGNVTLTDIRGMGGARQEARLKEAGAEWRLLWAGRVL